VGFGFGFDFAALELAARQLDSLAAFL
jgi:hypothetical protein